MPNLFPENISIVDLAAESSRPISAKKTWKFDFEKGDFVCNLRGKFYLLEEAEAWLEACQKALHTSRYLYLAYSGNYGQDYGSLIGSILNRKAKESELIRITTECLMTDPRTSGVSDFEFDWTCDGVVFRCLITNIWDQRVNLEKMVVNS